MKTSILAGPRRALAVLLALSAVAATPVRAADLSRMRSQSYTRAQLLARSGKLVPPEEVRADEWVNYQDYSFPLARPNDRVSLWAAASGLPPYLEAGGNRAYVMMAAVTEPFVSERTQPLDLVVVLDASGSMSAAGKMDYAKQAILRLAESLNERDRLGMVSFSDRASTVRDLSAFDSVDSVRDALEPVGPTNRTNLHGGLAMGMDMLLGSPPPGPPAYAGEGATARRLLVITDGIANVGVTDPAAIETDLAPGFKAGIRLTGIGVGLEYNDPLMKHLTRLPGNNGRFLDRPEEIGKSVLALFDSLMPVIVDRPRVRLSLPDGLRVADAFATEFEQNGREVDCTSLSSLGSDDHGIVLVEVEGAPDAVARLSRGECRVSLRATNAAEEKPVALDTQVRWLGSDAETDRSDGDARLAGVLTKASAVARAASAMRRASVLAGSRDFDGARSVVGAAREDLAATWPEGLPRQVLRIDALLRLDLDVIDLIAGKPNGSPTEGTSRVAR